MPPRTWYRLISFSACLFLQNYGFTTVRKTSIGSSAAGLLQRHRLYSSQDNVDTEGQFATFREAEVAGLRFMQVGSYTQAISVFLQALKLPGSRVDVIRSKLTPGPSPVGGAILGGTEGKVVYTLDEFEYQAAYYNLACAYAQSNQVDEVCLSFFFENLS